ncbi:MAG: hypothetical protein SPJ69_00570 [Campylobacter sp.]|uniref:hypothetical protein n=1 Tax=Campylobacter sp. TaxID=205 RepID=UPI002975CE2A|nr:hypothetical protein [Campylobacter sp.]MDD7599169.1 hypothetical protein [Campylobacteraceae bacterium]MDY5886791.1 hypothetical protein [Campylobacter sp.]
MSLALFGTENNATELNTTNEIAFGAAAKHKNLKVLEFPKKTLRNSRIALKFLIINSPKILQKR